jgi:hypothetical protein
VSKWCKGGTDLVADLIPPPSTPLDHTILLCTNQSDCCSEWDPELPPTSGVWSVDHSRSPTPSLTPY